MRGTNGGRRTAGRPELGPALAFGLLGLLAGCSGEAAGTCLTARDCAVGYLCVGNQCQAPSSMGEGCKRNEDCGLGEFCDRTTGMCAEVRLTTCADDSACPAHQRCQRSIGACVDGARTCSGDPDCAAIGFRCGPTGECVQCLGAQDCPSGWPCTGGRCVDPNAGNACSEDTDCRPPVSVCATDTCVPGCGQPGGAVCPSGFVCDARTGRCAQGNTSCTGDRDCGPPNRICEASQCIAGCTAAGGLACTGGNVCNATTGRCEAPSSCARDGDCTPPRTVCESASCVLGCAEIGGLSCQVGTVCDTGTGRCVPVQGPCTSDASCNPPRTVCEGGQCVGGCAEVGGVQCVGNTVCSQTTGRCEPNGNPSCTSDGQCQPPSTVCNLNTGACVAGCTTAGCGAMETCNPGTGRCDPMNPPPPMGGAALNDACVQNSDCASRVCFALPQGIGGRCVQSCGASSQCPSGFTCYDYNGARMCLSSALFSGASFAGAPGSVCTQGGQCQSNFCPGAPGQCTETCAESSHCAGGACQWYEAAADLWVSACNGPRGTRADGQSCTDDAQCRSGACPDGTCTKLCASTASCGPTETCAVANYSVCLLGVPGFCAGYQPNFVKVCAVLPHGADPVGSRCTDFTNCRSGLCHSTISQCTDFCSQDSDCPAAWRCKVEPYGQLDDGTNVFVNVCMPEAYNQ